MAVTAKDVKDLREKTGAGMMDCKKALVETDGDMEKAVEFLRKKGLASASKKEGRIAAEGAVQATVSGDQSVGALLEVNCETDFVAKTDDFQSLAKDLCSQVEAHDPSDIDALMKLELEGNSIETVVNQRVAKIGEKITPRRFQRFQTDSGVVHSYIHGGGTIGVLVELNVSDTSVIEKDEFRELYTDLAMHIAAAAPTYLKRDEVPSAEIDKEIDIYKEQLRKEGKKEEMLDKIAQGKLGKYYGMVCLLEQPFVKESKTKIEKLLKEVGGKVGADITIPRFCRFVLGEGIEKRNEDFAEEVAKAAGN